MAADRNGVTRLYRGEHTNQPLVTLVSFHDLARQLLLGQRGRIQILVRAAHLGGKSFTVLTDLVRLLLRKSGKVFEQYSLAGEKNLQAMAVANGTQRAAKQHA